MESQKVIIVLLFSRSVELTIVEGILNYLSLTPDIVKEIVHGKDLSRCPEVGELLSSRTEKVTGFYSAEDKNWREKMEEYLKNKDYYLIRIGERTENIRREEFLFRPYSKTYAPFRLEIESISALIGDGEDALKPTLRLLASKTEPEKLSALISRLSGKIHPEALQILDEELKQIS